MLRNAMFVFLITMASFSAVALTAAESSKSKASENAHLPNIVIILADDLGIGDLGCYNSASKIATPSMNRLATEGRRFTDAHSPSAVCTPTRYGLLTGRYCWRTWLKRSVLDGLDPPLIESDRVTLPGLLRKQGYHTACVGKWHLGMQWTTRSGNLVGRRELGGGFRAGDDVDFSLPFTGGPLEVGFDWFYGISGSLDMPPYCFLENDRAVDEPTLTAPAEESLTLNQATGVLGESFELEEVLPTLTRRAVSYIEGEASSNDPFFLYFPLTAPHLPVVPTENHVGKSKAGSYGDFVSQVDATVGAILDALDRTGQSSNTLIVLTSDNGSLWHWWDLVENDDIEHGEIRPRGSLLKGFGHQSNGHLRGLKGDVWEGGHRVPFVIRWPAQVEAGSTSDALVELTDMLATCAELTGTELSKDAGEDSFSFAPALVAPNSNSVHRNRLFAIHHSFLGTFAIRQGPWKLIEERGSGGFSRPKTLVPKQGEPTGQLYHLEHDAVESHNVWQENPDIVAELTKRLNKVRNQSRP